MIEKQDIKRYLPHREPFLFVDGVTEIIKDEYIKGFKEVKEDEYYFKGHFPDNPIVPGVIIIEAMAQTAGIVVSYKLKEFKEKSVLFMSVNKAKFRKPIFPNEKVLFEVNFVWIQFVYKQV